MIGGARRRPAARSCAGPRAAKRRNRMQQMRERARGVEAREGPGVARPAIELIDVTKRFGTFTAVDSLSLRVEPGEIFGLLGLFGTGKATTVNMLSGLSRP